jgi:hypothetical protein
MESIKISRGNLTYIPKLTQLHSYREAIGSQNRVRQKETHQKHNLVQASVTSETVTITYVN